MKRTLACLMLAALASACGDFIDGSDLPSMGRLTSLSFDEEYGFCISRCFRSIDVSAAGVAAVAVRDRRGGAATFQRTFTLSRAETSLLFDLAADSAVERWDELYGCPDCVDQGRYDLAIHGSRAMKSTILDPQDHPAHFDPLVDELRDVLHANMQ